MGKIKFVHTAFLLLASSVVAAQSYKVDADASKMIWTGKQITGQHQGSVNVSSGKVAWGEEGLKKAEVVIDMASISNHDMEREYAARLERHLKSSDFFNTAQFKTASFKTTGVEKIPGVNAGEPNYNVTGDLTIKGITKPVTFAVLAWKEKKGMRAAGTMVFDRTLYDVQFRSGKFFDALGDKMIDDMVEITFDLVAR